DGLGGSVVLRCFCLVAGLLRVRRHHQGLARIRIELLELRHLAVQSQFALLLIRDDVGGLLLQPAVLRLGFGQRLLQLNGGVGAVLEVAVELGTEVLPPLLESLEHGGDATRLWSRSALASTVFSRRRARATSAPAAFRRTRPRR